ncbi:MAG: DUF7289 family protein [Methanoculleaceae archaeon]
MRDAGVSEAVGFILIFSIVMTAIGIVTLYGYPVLLNRQSATYQKTMEQNMLVLQHDIRNLAFEMVPYRETTIQVGGGVLSFADTGRLIVKRNGDEILNSSPGGLEFRSDDGEFALVLSNGAVMTRYTGGGGSAMIGTPGWFYDDSTSTLLITDITMVEAEPVSFSGLGTIGLEAGGYGSDTYEYADDGMSVTITCTGPYRTAWMDYLENDLGFSQIDGNGCRKDGVQRLVIRSQVVYLSRS